MQVHPKGSSARILLSSVFGTYPQEDEFGSRSIKSMELYHNQVTRVQGAYPLQDVPSVVGHPDDPAQR
jgi:hypothetical protein